MTESRHNLDAAGIASPRAYKDGKRLFLAVSGIEGSAVGDVWSVPAEGGKAEPLGSGLQRQYFLSVHPDGRQIAFMNETHKNELWVMKNLFATKP